MSDEPTMSKDEIIIDMHTDMEAAVKLAFQHGPFDGAHHKQWVIDQMVRVLLGGNYKDWVEKFNEPDDYDDWDVGIAP